MRMLCAVRYAGQDARGIAGIQYDWLSAPLSLYARFFSAKSISLRMYPCADTSGIPYNDCIHVFIFGCLY